METGAVLKKPDSLGFESDIKIPERIFTPEMIALIKKGKPYRDLFRFSTTNAKASDWYEKIPISKWKELISPFAPVSIAGSGFVKKKGKCPFCGKLFEGCSMNLEEFFSTPFQAKTRCCGKIVYARKEDMPADYPAKPNHTEAIPHLDGTMYNYEFYVPPGSEEDRNNWFCSEGEIWRVRLPQLIYVFWTYSGITFNKNDEKAAVHLAAMFDRLADVFPGYPLYNRTAPHGFALGRDGKSYLTREEYLSIQRPKRFEKPFWYRRAWHFDKISTIWSGWQDGVTAQAGVLAACFDMIRDRPEVRAWSTAKYGSPDAFEKRVMERVFKEYLLLCSSIGSTRKNTVMCWVRGALKLGILMREKYLIQEALCIIESNVANHYFSDGLSTEGSFAYAGMRRSMLNNLWMVEHFGGVDLNRKYPLLKRIRVLGDYPIRTLYGIESMHGDEHGRFFATFQASAPASDSVDYAAHATSLCFPETGVGCIRAGVPGSRLEMIMDFQSTAKHSHWGKLNLQLFYEGINLLPDLGYGTTSADISKPPWKDYKYNFEKLPSWTSNEYYKGWRGHYTYQPQTHCTALIDGIHHKRGPATFHRFLGGQRLSEPGYSVQFLEVDARAMFDSKMNSVMGRPMPCGEVSRFRRQIFTLTLGNGRAIALDIFRIKGGRRHDLYWHLPAQSPSTSLGEPEKLSYKTVREYMRAVHTYLPKDEVVKTDKALRFLNRPRRWNMPDKMWQTEWAIQPSRFEPASPEGRKKYEEWARILHDVNLRIWGYAGGSKAEKTEIISARGPWPSKMVEKKRKGRLIALKDTLDYFIESRRAEEEPLESTFVHVLEPYNPGQQPVLADVEVLEGEGESAAGGCALRLKVQKDNRQDDTSNVFLATTLNGGAFHTKDIRLRGRLGMVCRDNLNLVLYDGVELQTRDVKVDLEAGWRLQLVEVIGDLSGRPEEGALVVDCAHPLPTDGTLAGQMLTVYHQISDLHTIGYTIKSIKHLREQRYRIDLQWGPPFIQNRMYVRKLDKKKPCHVYGTARLYKGSVMGLYQGRRIRFPRTGFSCAIRNVSGSLELDTTPGENDIQVGDPMIIYSIQPGDTVVIPSLFAARAVKRDARDDVELRIFTTGTATLRLPDSYQVTSLVSGGRRARFRKRKREGRLTITIDHNAIKDGRAVLSLSTR